MSMFRTIYLIFFFSFTLLTKILLYFTGIVQRHAGVLAVCSCLMAAPYDVPEWVPELVVRLSDHLHDPQPIEVRNK